MTATSLQRFASMTVDEVCNVDHRTVNLDFPVTGVCTSGALPIWVDGPAASETIDAQVASCAYLLCTVQNRSNERLLLCDESKWFEGCDRRSSRVAKCDRSSIAAVERTF